MRSFQHVRNESALHHAITLSEHTRTEHRTIVQQPTRATRTAYGRGTATRRRRVREEEARPERLESRVAPRVEMMAQPKERGGEERERGGGEERGGGRGARRRRPRSSAAASAAPTSAARKKKKGAAWSASRQVRGEELTRGDEELDRVGGGGD